MKNIIAILLIITLLAGCASRVEVLTWQEQYDLGVRYLSEGNYEEAILAFTAAIEIDPRQPDAYVQLAEIYTELGEEEKLSEILATAKEQFGEEEFMQMLPEKEPENNLPEEETENLPSENNAELLRTGDPITISGVVQYSDQPTASSMEHCFIDGLDTIYYQYENLDGNISQWQTEVLNTKDDDTILLKQYLGQTVTISGVFEAEVHGVPFIADIDVIESFEEAEPQVIDAYYEEIQGGKYAIPKVVIAGTSAKAANDKIYEELYPYIEDLHENFADGLIQGGPYGMFYAWITYDDVISIIVKVGEWDGGWEEFYSYNVSAKTGELLTLPQLLQHYGMSEAAFHEKATAAMVGAVSRAEPTEGADLDEETLLMFDKWYQQDVEITSSPENLAKIKPYINEDGRLCIAAQISAMADWLNYKLLDVETGEEIKILVS